MSAQIEVAGPQALFSYLSIVQKQNYSLVAATSFLMCDILYTFFDEIEYIWKAKWSFAKVLYILGRYYNLSYLLIMSYFSLIHDSSTQYAITGVFVALNILISRCSDDSHHRCKGFGWYMMVGGNTLSALLLNMLFCLRMYALYNGDRRVVAIFAVLSFAELIAEIYSSIISGLHLYVLSVPGLTFPGCIIASSITGSSILSAWIAHIIINSIYFIASLARLSKFSGWRKEDPYRSNDSGSSGLLTILIRDGAVYYALTVSFVSVGMAMTLIAHGRYYFLITYWLNAVYSFAGAHMILNLRRAGRPAHTLTATSMVDMPINFRSFKEPDHLQRGSIPSRTPYVDLE